MVYNEDSDSFIAPTGKSPEELLAEIEKLKKK